MLLLQGTVRRTGARNQRLNDHHTSSPGGQPGAQPGPELPSDRRTLSPSYTGESRGNAEGADVNNRKSWIQLLISGKNMKLLNLLVTLSPLLTPPVRNRRRPTWVN